MAAKVNNPVARTISRVKSKYGLGFRAIFRSGMMTEADMLFEEALITSNAIRVGITAIKARMGTNFGPVRNNGFTTNTNPATRATRTTKAVYRRIGVRSLLVNQ